MEPKNQKILSYLGAAGFVALTLSVSIPLAYRESEPELVIDRRPYGNVMAEGKDGPTFQKFTLVTQEPNCSVIIDRIDFLKGTKIYVDQNGDYSTVEKVTIHPPMWDKDRGIQTYYLNEDFGDYPEIFLEAELDFDGQIKRFNPVMNLTDCL